MILLIRLLHGIITVFFLSCLAYVYYSGISNNITLWSYLAMAALIIEGLVVAFNKGLCPLGRLHNKYGDQKTFFELFLPQPLAKKAVPFLGLAAAIGFFLLIL
jgi:hypothetical protein